MAISPHYFACLKRDMFSIYLMQLNSLIRCKCEYTFISNFVPHFSHFLYVICCQHKMHHEQPCTSNVGGRSSRQKTSDIDTHYHAFFMIIICQSITTIKYFTRTCRAQMFVQLVLLTIQCIKKNIIDTNTYIFTSVTVTLILLKCMLLYTFSFPHRYANVYTPIPL